MSHVLPVRTKKGRRNVFSLRVVSARTQKSALSLERGDECNQYQAKETLRKRRFLSSSSSRFLVRNTRRHISQESSRRGEKRSEALKVVTKSKEHVAEKTVARASSFRAEERKREKGLPPAARRRVFFFDVFERHSNVWRRRRRRHEG